MNITIKQLSYIIIFALLTFSNSAFAVKYSLSNGLENFSFLLVITCIYYSYFKMKRRYRQKNILPTFVVVLAFLTIGIINQDLNIYTKLNLVFSMFIIASLAITSENLFSDYSDIKVMSLGILLGVSLSFITSPVSGQSLFTQAVEGVGSSFGFNGGMQHKNYFAADIFSAFIGLYVYNKYKTMKVSNKSLLLFLIFLILISNSRTIYILCFLFIIIINIDKLNLFKKTSRSFLVLLAISIFIIICYYAYNFYALRSESYLYRVRGLFNYLAYYSKDSFHMLFGTADMAFRDSGLSFTANVRSITGWDGTVELTLLNILIKNGIMGIFAYLLIILRWFKTCMIRSSDLYSIPLKAIVVVFITSAFVETYMVNMHIMFGIFCYLFIAFCSHNVKLEKGIAK